jgi:hypothetical protein
LLLSIAIALEQSWIAGLPHEAKQIRAEFIDEARNAGARAKPDPRVVIWAQLIEQL